MRSVPGMMVALALCLGVAAAPAAAQAPKEDLVPVAIDTRGLHFFEEASGAPLR